ncbi:MAG TPA: pirin family protein [Polyangiaceae bacterium]|nr:pirin family protein [Polyangiaceae bacterium]
MLKIRRASERGHANHGWLDSFHSFSFADYYDPNHMGFRNLRVINEDRVAPGRGFGTHGHRDMEIVSYVLEGALEHKDSLGTGSVIRPGDVQRMSAGTGVTHSEFNASRDEEVHFLQIWLLPGGRGLKPSYEQKTFEPATGALRLIVSPTGEGESLTIHTDARIYAASLTAGQSAQHTVATGRHAWVQVARGSLVLNGRELSVGDGAAISDESSLSLEARSDAEVLVFDLP